MIPRLFLAALCALLLGLILAGPAQAAEAPNHPFRFEISEFEPEPHRFEFLEGPCGLALDAQGDIYVGDYYHDQVLAFGPSGAYTNRLVKEEPLDGPCGLAVDSSGRLYVNNLHRNVLRFTLSPFPPAAFPRNQLTETAATTIDSAHSTGLALDSTGDLYVDDRTYVAKYNSSGSLLAKIGLGNLEDGYGVAVSGFPATAGFIYVPDAATNTVKVFDPATSTTTPVAEIDGAGTPQGGFASLFDSAVAIDNSDGHLFVADNLQRLDYEHPRAALDEFNAAGDYRGQLPKIPALFESEPTAVAVDNSGGASQGDVFVTSGNSELAKVYAYGPTGAAHTLTVTKSGSGTVKSEPAGIECGTACVAEYSAGAEVALTPTPAPGSAFAGWSGACAGTGACTVTMSEAKSVGAEFEVAPLSAVAQPGTASSPSAAAATLPSPSGESAPPSAIGPSVSSSTRRHHRRRHARLRSSMHGHR
jgi:DNA-binding beta-propeller fold protein YncE